MRARKRAATSTAPEHDRETIGFRRRRERRDRATAFLKGSPLLVGLDLAKRKHAVWIARSDLSPAGRLMIPHSHEGVSRLLEVTEAARLKGEHDRTLFFMEPTSYFWENVANRLEAKGLDYRVVSTLAVDRQREIEHQTYAKGDYRDAELIVRLGHGGQWLDRRLETEQLWLDLRALTREHETLLVDEISERLRIRSLLGLAVPEFFDAFKSPIGTTARAILKRITRPVSEIPRSFPSLIERIRTVDSARAWRGKVRALVARLEAGSLFGVERSLAPSLARLGLSVDRYEFLADQRQEVRARLLALYQQTCYRAVLDTFPGVRAESQALLLGLIGDPRRYDRATCLAKLGGTEPRENHSGEAEGSHSISRRGQAPLRHVVYRIVCGLRVGNDEFAAYLKRIMTREKNRLVRNQAAVAAGNKYLRVFHHMCVKQEVYDASKLTSD